MKSIKKTVSILFVVLILVSSFSVLSFASGIPQTTKAKTEDTGYSIQLVSSLDEKETAYISGSQICIYKIPDGSAISSNLISAKNLYSRVRTNDKGVVEIKFTPGTYLIKEDNFKYNGKEYQAEVITLSVTKENHPNTVYLKHSLVGGKDTPTTTRSADPFTPNNNSKNPRTGDNPTLTYVALGVVGLSLVVIFVLARKKKTPENTKPENNNK